MCECSCCGLIFDEPAGHIEERGECFGFPAIEYVYGCPYCGGGYMRLEDD